jgi:predicted GTPase
VLDTAGVDDAGELGEKKKAKSLQALKEVDLALLVIDPATKKTGAADPAGLSLLGSLLAEVTRRGRQVSGI